MGGSPQHQSSPTLHNSAASSGDKSLLSAGSWVGGLFARSRQQKLPPRHRADLWAATIMFVAAENDNLRRDDSPNLPFPDGEGTREAADEGESG